jgi:ATP-binding cassette subfamily B protein RaxB
MIIEPDLSFARRPRVPMIHAVEAAECGLACIAMVACYHGHQIDLVALRQRFSVSLAGSTLRNLMQVAEPLGLGTRPVRLEMSDLPRIRLPAVIHWDVNQFVVLTRIDRKTATIHDPARGVRKFSLAEFSKHFTGAALEVSPIDGFRKLRQKTDIRLNTLWSRMEGFWGGFFQVLALSLTLQIAAFGMPFQLQLVVDEAIGRSDVDLLAVLAIGFGFLIVLQALIEMLRGWSLQVFGQSLVYQVVGNLVRHLIRLPSDYFEKRHVGDILSRMGSASAIQDILTKGVVSSIIDGLMAVVSVTILFIYSPRLASVVILAVTLNFAVSLAVFPFLRRRMEEQLMESARERSHIMETVRAATTIKLMGREAEREAQWRNLYANVINASVAVGKYSLSLAGVQSAIAGIQFVLVVYLGARAVIAGDGFTVGMLVAFLSFRQTFTDRANSLVDQLTQFRFLGLHLERLSDIVSAEREPSHVVGPGLSVRGAIELRDISFRYGATDPKVLESVNLTIEPGEYVAITGVSGGGKSTLIKLMLGIRAPTSGEILLDGQVAKPALWRSWRERVGVVAQEDRLLSGSVAENIAFFDADLDMDRVEAAARAAQVHDDIGRMPMQYLSLIGDMGSTLSGGQKQRILLARALYRRPSVLYLDEGTANLDQHTELAIADLISTLPMTRIVVAHRPALLRRADRVLTVKDGSLHELNLVFGSLGPSQASAMPTGPESRG